MMSAVVVIVLAVSIPVPTTSLQKRIQKVIFGEVV